MQSLPESATILLGDTQLTPAHIAAIAQGRARIEFSETYRRRVTAASDLVDHFLAQNRLIYGVTTGFGDNYTEVIAPQDAQELQRNIVLSHAVSVGEPLPDEQVRATMVAMLAGLGLGHAGTRLATLELLRRMLEQGVTPVVPGEGSVGYLAHEAHIALVLIGEGRARFEGQVMPGLEALTRAGLAPVVLQAKEGLTLTNGGHAVNALAALAVHRAERAARTADVVAALSVEALEGTTRAFDPRLQSMRRHPEQAQVAARLLALLKDSPTAERSRDLRVQDPLMLRTIPQTHAASRRSITQAADTVQEALGSTGDNPAIIPDGSGDGDAIMGGNFDGGFLALACDGLCMGATVLAKISERRTDRMMQSSHTGLPAFLTPQPGLNNGLMIPQYTAAALVMEMRALASPASVDSIGTSANQEDPVSNAFLAARQALQCAQRLDYVLSIELLCAVQALDLRGGQELSSPALQRVRSAVRATVPFAPADRLFGRDIEALYRLVTSDSFAELLMQLPTASTPGSEL